ncbi:MAG: hypothetical protein IJ609_02045, partial [Paludibacteraceae bacterium]|nr:hypothetical protein [Paludibacteraceae bacterium]
KAKMAFDGVRVINTTYDDPFKGDVKSAGSNVILSGVNSFPAGIALNKQKRVQHSSATHTTPITIKLSHDYLSGDNNTYSIVLTCSNPTLYSVVLEHADVDYELYASGTELKARPIAFTLEDNADNATTLAEKNGIRANVTLNRTIARNGDYATFCAPFAISREALEEHLGTTEVLRYKRTVIEGDEAVLIFDDDVTDLEAGVPYLIKPAGGDNVTSMTFNNVVIDNTLRESADDHYRFIPLFSQETVSNTGAENKSVVYLGASNQLYWAGPTCTINGFRAYFRVADGAAATMAPVRRMSFDRGAGVTTALDNSAADAAQSKRLENGRLVIVRDGVRYNALGQVVK